jgi:type II secretory pathway component PulJ
MRLASRPGYSLVELLMTVAIGTVIAGGIVALLMSQVQLTATQNRNMLNQENLRDVIRFMTDEIRLAATTDGSEPIIAANGSDMEFYADIDGNGVTDTVGYYVAEGVLLRRFTTTAGGNAFEATDPLLAGVQSLVFVYYGPDDVEPANIGEITSVEIQLVMNTSVNQTDFSSERVAPQRMAGRATIRNKLLD